LSLIHSWDGRNGKVKIFILFLSFLGGSDCLSVGKRREEWDEPKKERGEGMEKMICLIIL